MKHMHMNRISYIVSIKMTVRNFICFLAWNWVRMSEKLLEPQTYQNITCLPVELIHLFERKSWIVFIITTSCFDCHCTFWGGCHPPNVHFVFNIYGHPNDPETHLQEIERRRRDGHVTHAMLFFVSKRGWTRMQKVQSSSTVRFLDVICYLMTWVQT